tara:strand:- start:520 stop:927 length:408 start_codon:yes stop_codon:yes gene_type:complete
MINKEINESFLRKYGLKPTRQRLLLSKILFSNGDRHFTAEEIRRLVISEGTKISLATIYNNLHNMVDVGLLKKRQVDNSRAYFDNNVTNHYHLFDEERKTLIDIPSSSIKFSKLPKIPKNKKIKNINLIINLAKK